ncbi:uncharacterized protein LOC143846795 [Tasmannia lanceolata]|uniref:uncharacterized protein LOC143846795 n=1 Tax=Tasmannia lanceolata TaxID=3420 RepID=UPI004063C5E6
MGTKVQSKNCLLEHFFMGDLNGDANTGNWSPFYGDKMFTNAQYYNGFTQRPVDVYLDYDKELLKQTMLRHEAIFRKQVCELHRLYRIQRDLMSDLQRKELHKYSISAFTSQSNPISSQVPCEDTQTIWKMPTFSMVNSGCCAPSISGTNIQSPLNFLKESIVQAGSRPMQNGSSVNDCDLSDSKPRKFLRRTFDLQLPADEYIVIEDGEGIEEEKVREVSLAATYSFNRICGVEPDSDLKLTLSTGGHARTSGDSSKSGQHLQNSLHTHYLADLNEPIRGNEGAEAPGSPNFVGPVASHEVIQGELSAKPNLSILGSPRDFFQGNQKEKDHRTFSNLLQAENEGTRREWLSFNLEPGKTNSNTNPFTPVFCHEKSATSSESTQLKLKKAHELPPFLLSDKSKNEAWLREKTCGAEISKKSCSLTISNYSGLAAFQIPNSSSSIQSPGVSREKWIQIPDDTEEKWYLNGNHRSHPISGGEISYQNGFNHPFQSESNRSVLHSSLVGFNKLNHLNGGDNFSYEKIEGCCSRKYCKGLGCKDVKSAKDMNLNLCPPNGFSDRISHRQDFVFIDGGGKNGDPMGPSWLRPRPARNESMNIIGGSTQMDLGFLPGYSLPVSDRDAMTQKFESENKTEKGRLPPLMPDFRSTLLTKDAEAHRTEMTESSKNNKILNLPVLQKPCFPKDQCVLNSPSVSCRDISEINDAGNTVKDGLLHVDLPYDLTLPGSEMQLCADNPVVKMGIDNSSKGSSYDINLNSAIEACKEQTKSLEVSYTTDAIIPTSSPLRRTSAKNTIEIDLEAPIIPEVLGNVVDGVESPRTNQLVAPVQQSQCERVDPQAKVAAEAIITISSGVSNRSDPSSTALRDSLCWFAEMVSSIASDLESTVGASRGKVDGDQEYSDDGIDFFEAMTLKLSETKVEEFYSKPWEQENQNVEETSSSPLVTQPRKGQARRGRQRQRRDFQKDILPGLASLSRHEVTEDIQTFGGLMRASGCFWKSGLARRNAARNGWHCPTRGRGQSRGSASASAGILVGLPPTQPGNSEVELEGISLQGWGKTTRRRQRQRFPTGNAASLLT